MESESIDLYGEEALAEVSSYLEKVAARCLDPIVTSEDICTLIRTHFGVNPRAAWLLRNHVIRVLRDRGVLVVWDTRELAQKLIVEYRVNLAPTSCLSP